MRTVPATGQGLHDAGRKAAWLTAALTFEARSPRTGREVFVGMDALRAAAALMILVYHAHSIATKNAASQGVAIFAEPQWWYACIDLFFVMSGFLMVHMSQTLYGSARGALIFASRRLVRTPPLYWLYTLVFALAWFVAPFLPGATPITPARLVHSLLFIPDGHPPIILVAWTLILEVQFYVIFGLGVMLPKTIGPAITIAVLVALSLAGTIPGVAASRYAIWTDPLLLDFCLGILVALLYFSGATLSRFGVVMAAVIAVVAVSALPDLGTRNFLRLPTYGLAAACLVAIATWRETSPVRARWVRPLSLISTSAYSLYLAHISFLKVTEAVFFRAFTGTAACYAYIPIGCVVALAGSWVAYQVVERPLTRWLKPLAMRR